MSLEWKAVRLDEVGKIITGKTPKTSIEDNYGGNIPFLTPSDDMNIKTIYETNKTLTLKGLNEVKNCLLPKNSVCVSCIGSDLGKVVLTSENTVTNQQINSIIVNDDFDYNFIYYMMILVGKQLNFMSKSSTAVPIINKSTFSKEIINVPPLDEQRKISSILSNIDAKIENLLRINKNLATLAKTIFRDRFIFYKGYESRMIKTEFGEIPDTFEVKSIDEISKDVVCGKTPSTKVEENYGDKMPFITIPDMHGNVFVINTERKLSEIGIQSQIKKILPKNSICVSCIATAGLVSLTSEESQTNQQINSIICKDGISPYFIYLYMEELSEYIKILGSGGSTTLNLNKREFGKIKLTIPPQKDMLEFHNHISPLFEKIKYNQHEINNLTMLRDTLLPKLMSGEIDVSKIKL